MKTPDRSAALHHGLPLLVVGGTALILWYVGALYLNAPQVIEQLARIGQEDWTWSALISEAYAMKRPVLPTPDQIVVEIWQSTVKWPIDSVRNLFYHVGVTASSTLVGFALGSTLGIVLAVGIVHAKTLESSLLPWIIASQTIPILAIAPMIVVVLGNMGFTGLVPKSIISMYLCFFPITIGMVKGLRSADKLALDLMRTYSATRAQVFWKLRLPAAMPFLFTSMKVAIAISLVGAIVGELPTGSQAGLGSRLLSGSYYGQTVQIWAALIAAAILSLGLVFAVEAIQRVTLRASGARP